MPIHPDVEQEYVSRAASIVAELCVQYPQVHSEQVVKVVETATEAMSLIGLLDDPDGGRILRLLSERDIRLRLGLDVEQAHLDPQVHPRRVPTGEVQPHVE